MDILSDMRAKHHFVIDKKKVYTLEFPPGDSLQTRCAVVTTIKKKLEEALENETKQKFEKDKSNSVKEKCKCKAALHEEK